MDCSPPGSSVHGIFQARILEWVAISYFKNKKVISESCSVVSDSLKPQGLYSPWNSPGQNTGVDSLSLLLGIFPTQGSNQGLPGCRQLQKQNDSSLAIKAKSRTYTSLLYNACAPLLSGCRPKPLMWNKECSLALLSPASPPCPLLSKHQPHWSSVCQNGFANFPAMNLPAASTPNTSPGYFWTWTHFLTPLPVACPENTSLRPHTLARFLGNILIELHPLLESNFCDNTFDGNIIQR